MMGAQAQEGAPPVPPPGVALIAPPPLERVTCTQAEFARMQGWGRSYVTKLKLEGRLVMDGELVDVAASIARIQATTERRDIASPPAVSHSARSDRDRQAFYDAERSRLDLEERVGRLLARDDMLAVLNDAAVTLRSALETWPERLSPALATLAGDEARMRAHLAEHVEAALAEVSRRFGDLAAEAHAKGPAR